MKKILILPIVAIFGLSLAGTSFAAQVLIPDRDEDPNITITSIQTFRNLYTAGKDVTINGATTGDLTAAGGMVNITGDVEQGLLLAGGELNVSSQIGGTARILGGNINVNGPVRGDLVALGGNINLTNKASIGGDLMLAGGTITIESPVAGGVRLAGDSVIINSKINGDVYAQTVRKLTFGPGAEVTGTIYHTGSRPAVVMNGARVGQINFAQMPGRGRDVLRAIITIAFLIKLAGLFITGWLLLHFKKHLVLKIEEGVRAKPWHNLGLGLVYAIVTPVVIVALGFTGLGLYPAVVLGLAYVLLAVLVKILAALTLGFLLVGYLTKRDQNLPLWQPLLIGVVIWELLIFIPILGWLVLGILFLMTFGVLVKILGVALKEL